MRHRTKQEPYILPSCPTPDVLKSVLLEFEHFKSRNENEKRQELAPLDEGDDNIQDDDTESDNDDDKENTDNKDR